MMKKFRNIFVIVTVSLFAFSLTACNSGGSNEAEDTPVSAAESAQEQVDNSVPSAGVFIINTPMINDETEHPDIPSAEEFVEYCPKGIKSITPITDYYYRAGVTNQLILVCEK